jgi:hypothetical protein
MIAIFWLASAAGAALFFVAGWLSGRVRGPRMVGVPQPMEPTLSQPEVGPELIFLRGEIAAARVEETQQRQRAEKAYHDLDGAKAQIERLRIDLMRAQKGTSDLQVEQKRAQGELGKLREELARAAAPRLSRAPLQVRAAGHKAGDVLQALVDRMSGEAEIRCAVVADDLGLVVASHGELGDEVAAVGALFGRAGLQAQRVLPLRKVQRVTVEDDHNVTLTLRPLQTDGSVEGDLALITLAVGAEPRRARDERSLSVRPT